MNKIIILSLLIIATFSTVLSAKTKLSREDKSVCSKWKDIHGMATRTYKSNKNINKEEYKKNIEKLEEKLTTKCNFKFKKSKKK